MLADDLDVYLADFGVPCVANGCAFTGLLDQPDDSLRFESGQAQSSMRRLTVKTSDIGAASISAKTSITIGGAPYTVSAIEQLGDEAFTHLRVRKS